MDRQTPLLQAFLDGLLGPQTCLICGLALPKDVDHLVCPPCFEELPWLTTACPYCAHPVSVDMGECHACELRRPDWDLAVCPLRYAPPVDRLVQRLKFQGRLREGDWLAYALAQALRHREARPWPDVVIAVPMHPWRRVRRGFNHASYLAERVAQQLDAFEAVEGWLHRVRWTAPQTGLDGAARRRNLTGALRWRGPTPPPRHVAVVDDVITTGATASAVSRALLDAGVETIEMWACARAATQANR